MTYHYTEGNTEIMSIMNQGEEHIHQCTVSDELAALIKLLISKINGCNYCINLHKKELKELGVTQMKIDEVRSYNHLDLFTDKERITLEFAEKLNTVKEFKKFDILESLKEFYSEKEIIELVFIINQISSWNRLNIIGEQFY
ncbi:carboxymuconolactone decarboxylase family protein [Staphylococcus simiae]|uniref:Alkylhydroperoxidase n=1 Tax=Staphylococcus simiae CCM 7213 = CCUG 51256 TaxID=911238 RepID=G5JHY9_9STAP|nr:carboxymuconolactone decarboxylase family protein [Staphylococcus simiae]EHJ08182.1 alkylhydroperoxidase [Staphylococcus simiae CCM 7213 = CCUG 51256]MBO1198524.1 carboxymuconolactone decarboxylase family protein [Staphylococcus simiae]MBO1200678.1 carboxymuconolactone decarboxylase family protein [Staphylococcus simiae]MBO1202930.1 carboxymuconolactone decarboxylase family protein [Staphylococcus simiae]MBO1210515.1 carboxymuconolactone decarboxylase family protein [Staphylococcus simiae]